MPKALFGGSSWPTFGTPVDAWRRQCVTQMVTSVQALSQSYVSLKVCIGICDALKEQFPNIEMVVGSIEFPPKAVGAASLPFDSRFMVRERVLS